MSCYIILACTIAHKRKTADHGHCYRDSALDGRSGLRYDDEITWSVVNNFYLCSNETVYIEYNHWFVLLVKWRAGPLVRY